MKEKIVQFIKRHPGVVIVPLLFVLLVSPLYVLPEKQSKTYECCLDYISYPVLKTIHFSIFKIFIGFSNEEVKMMEQVWDHIYKLHREKQWKSQEHFCPLEKK